MEHEENRSEPNKESSQNNNQQDPKGFDPQSLQKEFQEMVEQKFGGKVQVYSMDDPFQSMGAMDDEIDDDADRLESLRSIEEFDYKPKDIKKYLDRFVVSQDEAKKALAIAICDHYNHLRTEFSETSDQKDQHYQKQNILILGPTGVGKTYLVRLVADLIGVPFVKADATRFSEVGYMGANVDDIIRDLVQVAGGDQHLASKGIVYVDEVDKLASRRDHTGRDVSGRGVQFGFLRLLENSDVDLNASHDIASQFKTFMNFQKKGKADKEVVNTRDILFIFSGAFHGLEDIINKRTNEKAIGLHAKTQTMDIDQAFKKVEANDLVNFGFEHEFIGRLPIRVSCDQLSVEDLFKILKDSEHSIVQQYTESFLHYGISLKFTDQALKLLCEKAYEQKTGARALMAVFEELLRPFKFELPSTKITDLVVDEAMVKNPMGSLLHLTNSDRI